MKSIPLALAALILVIGCGGPAEKTAMGPDSKMPDRAPRENLSTVEETMLGKWEGEPVEKEAEDTDGDGKPDESRDSSMFSPALAETIGGYELTLEDNGNFKLSMTGQDVRGEWILTGDQLELKPEVVLGSTREEAEAEKDELVLELFDSNWTLTVKDSGKLLEFPEEGLRPLVKFTKS